NITISGSIYKRLLQIQFSNGTKVYDSTYLEYNLAATLSGIIGPDNVTISGYTTIFKSILSGNQLIDISNFVITGSDSFNYYFIPIQAYMGFISKRPFTIKYIPANKVYNAVTFSNYSVEYDNFIGPDTVLNSLSGIISYSVYGNYNSQIVPTAVNWIIVGSGIGEISYSTDGITWYIGPNDIFTSGGGAIAYNDIYWVAVGSGHNTIAYSSNGINWTGLDALIFNQVGLTIVWTGTLWLGGGQGNNTLAYSSDGINWFGLGSTIFSSFVSEIATNKLFNVAVGQGNNTFAYSYDGINWVGLGNIIFDNMGITVVTNNLIWVAFGKGSINTMAYSYDGINWIGLGTSIFSDSGNNCIWDGTKFVAVGQGTVNTIAYSYDGINWTGLGNTIFSSYGLSIAYNGTKYIAGGVGTNTYASSNNGINWSPLNINNNITVPYGIACKKFLQFINSNNLINVGTYNVVPGSLISNNYNIFYIGGITTITKATLTIAPNTTNLQYSNSLFTNYGLNYIGFAGNDSVTSVSGIVIYYYSNPPLNVGIYVITPSGLFSNNYNIINVSRT
ncbi:MAG: hypothetical protein EBR91_11390, partial [Flavobacteriia bacterium]|nr:hypothetical protein [Flavobacteriia bacterium]